MIDDGFRRGSWSKVLSKRFRGESGGYQPELSFGSFWKVQRPTPFCGPVCARGQDEVGQMMIWTVSVVLRQNTALAEHAIARCACGNIEKSLQNGAPSLAAQNPN